MIMMMKEAGEGRRPEGREVLNMSEGGKVNEKREIREETDGRGYECKMCDNRRVGEITTTTTVLWTGKLNKT